MDPFAPIPQSSPTTGPTEPCPRCGQPMDPQQASYDGAGRLVCRTCMSSAVVAQANRTIEEKDPTSTRNLYLGAATTMLISVATCCMSLMGRYLFLLSPAAFVSGIWTVQHLLRNPETKAQLGGGYWVVMILSIVGMLFALGAIVVGVLSMIAAGMS